MGQSSSSTISDGVLTSFSSLIRVPPLFRRSTISRTPRRVRKTSCYMHEIDRSGEYEDALSSVLECLYDLVGRPVAQRLHELNIPEQSRVWLCPTTVSCSLPLYAIGQSGQKVVIGPSSRTCTSSNAPHAYTIPQNCGRGHWTGLQRFS